MFKIPLSPTLRTSGSNTVSKPLPNVPGMPEAGAVAVAIDGVPMFPNYNNRGKFMSRQYILIVVFFIASAEADTFETFVLRSTNNSNAVK